MIGCASLNGRAPFCDIPGASPPRRLKPAAVCYHLFAHGHPACCSLALQAGVRVDLRAASDPEEGLMRLSCRRVLPFTIGRCLDYRTPRRFVFSCSCGQQRFAAFSVAKPGSRVLRPGAAGQRRNAPSPLAFEVGVTHVAVAAAEACRVPRPGRPAASRHAAGCEGGLAQAISALVPECRSDVKPSRTQRRREVPVCTDWSGEAQ